MAYKALYRQFRPRRFSEIKDQDVISEILKNQVITGCPSHAYVFAGPRGTGKTSTAKILACALNCLSPENGEPCLKCENCLSALNDVMPDIIEMDAASNTGVDDARALIEKVNLLPAAGKYKVYIIDEVHMLSNSAFNALLKTIEEPPDYAVFILATTELRKLPKTVLSRCQRFDFKAIGITEITKRLREVVDSIGKKADDDALEMIAEAADGGMRDALTILEKSASAEESITVKSVASVLNYAESGKIRNLLIHIAHYSEKEAMEDLIEMLESGIEPETLLSQMTALLRELLIANVTGGGRYSEDAKEWKRAAIIRAIDILSDAEWRMSASSTPRILLEAAVVKLLLPERNETPLDSDARFEKLEKKIADIKLKGVITENTLISGKKDMTDEKKKPELIKPSGDAVELFSKLTGYIKKTNLPLYAFIRDISAVSLENGVLTLTGNSDSKISMLNAGNTIQKIEASAEQLFGYKLSVKTINAGLAEIVIPEDVEIID